MADFTPKICHIVSLAKKQVFQRISFYRLVTWLKGENATASLSAAFTASSQRYSAMSDISRPAVERPVQTSLAPAASQQDPATASRTLAQSATDQQLPRKTSFYHIGDSTEVNETITAPQGDSFEELDMNEQDLAVEAYLDAAEVPTAPPGKRSRRRIPSRAGRVQSMRWTTCETFQNRRLSPCSRRSAAGRTYRRVQSLHPWRPRAPYSSIWL